MQIWYFPIIQPTVVKSLLSKVNFLEVEFGTDIWVSNLAIKPTKYDRYDKYFKDKRDIKKQVIPIVWYNLSLQRYFLKAFYS